MACNGNCCFARDGLRTLARVPERRQAVTQWLASNDPLLLSGHSLVSMLLAVKPSSRSLPQHVSEQQHHCFDGSCVRTGDDRQLQAFAIGLEVAACHEGNPCSKDGLARVRCLFLDLCDASTNEYLLASYRLCQVPEANLALAPEYAQRNRAAIANGNVAAFIRPE
jgi:hypothetical protein